MKRLFSLLISLCVTAIASAQIEQSIIIDQATFKSINSDVLTGVNIDPIGVDRSRRPCARIKVKINRMSREDIDKLDVKIHSNNELVKCKTADYDNGLIIEMSALQNTRFYFQHPEFGYSNEVNVNLEPNKEYYIEASLNKTYSIIINTNFEGADVYLDNIYKGVTNDNYQLTISNVLPGEHLLKVVYGGASPEQTINIHSGSISFRQDINIASAIPQHVVFKLSPTDALIEIDGNPVYGAVENDGYVDKLLKSGSYTYTVSAPNYYTQTGVIVVRDQKITQEVTLKPAFGYLKTDSKELEGAAIYVDGKYIGKHPINAHQLPSGEHQVRILKPKYRSFDSTVVIKDSEFTTLAPTLEPNFAKVIFKAADSSTEIWFNDTFVAKGIYTTDVEFGSYSVEGRKANHKSTPRVFDINSTGEITIEIPAAMPIYGVVDISSTPMPATIIVDGIDSGKQTPDRIINLLVGEHIITLEKPGYKTRSQTVKVVENEITEVKIQLISDASILQSIPQPKPKKEVKKRSVPVVKTKNHFESNVDLGYSLHAQPGSAINHVGLSYIGGLRANKIFVGLGLGAEVNFDGIDNTTAISNASQNFTNNSSGGTMMSSGAVSVPIYLHFRAYMGSRSRTFVAVSAGGKLFGSDNFEYNKQSFKYNTNGVFADLGIGLQLGKFFLSAGATTQTVPCAEFVSEKQIDLNSKLAFGAKISMGFTF